MKPKIAQIIPFVRLTRSLNFFDYIIPEELRSEIKVGQLVEIPFRNKMVKGVILGLAESSKYESIKLKQISKIVEPIPLLATWQITLIKDLSQYYFVSMATILKMLIPEIPKKVRLSRKKILQELNFLSAPKSEIALEQFYNSAKPILLRCYKFEDKIGAYLALIKKVLKQDKQIVIIAPTLNELNKIYQYLGDFKEEVSVFLNDLPKNKYYYEWLRIKNSQAKIILGTRSAIFAPFKNLDLIIIDEEDNENHKQEEPNPRYNVKTIALKLQKLIIAKVIFTARTPSMASLHNVALKEWQFYEINKPKDWPKIKIIDRQIEFKKGNYSIFSEELLKCIEYNLKRAQRIFLFLNRKGLATVLSCKDCGYLANCPTCKLPLTCQVSKELVCHHCNYKQDIFLFCPQCKSPNIKITGTGTAKVELEISKLFPQARVLKLDIDSPLNNKKIADYDIIIGTQYAFDYLNWKEINLACALNADTLLYLPDYRSAEKTFNLLAGLAISMADPKKEFLVQTFSADNYIFYDLPALDYKTFYKKEITERQDLHYPPVAKLVKLIYQSIEFNGGQAEINKVYRELVSKVDINKVIINPPLLAYTQQVRGRFRWQIIIKLLELDLKLDFLNDLPEDVIIDVEPENLL
ncbi:MAG: primosomal protein N' [Patescibacteria group bacterium]